MATFTLFYAVEHWNQFFAAVIYLNDTKKWPIQVLLRSIVILAQDAVGGNADQDPVNYAPLTIQMAVVVFATIPILIVYPFLQKHFAKGVLLGSVKG
jgi:putative aldouronate transport system permease protein